MAADIRYDRNGFIIDGHRRFILGGTINYFRIHPDQWESRLQALAACGFNTVDTYVPWNYHESVEGQFDFSTFNRDIERYLSLCEKLGLWVYFRPGPYICNEWDNGGLPVWLTLKSDIQIRQNQPQYLRFVLRYLHEVNQIARRHLYTAGGCIILYALENELDFYHCRDPHGYISALRDHSIADGIDVPLTACIGLRTHVYNATGLTEGVIPSPNIYTSGAIERTASNTYLRVLAGEFADGSHMDNLPVFVTEMGQSENAVRRMLTGGFKGLCLFNFAGGTHFGYWNSTTNWGSQTLIPTSIDFGSSITFDGRLAPCYFANRLIAGLVHAFEDQLLFCRPITAEDRGPRSDNPQLGWKDTPETNGMIYSLTRDDAGFVFLYNGTQEPQELSVLYRDLRFPQFSKQQIAPGYTHIALMGLSLEHTGIPAKIRYSSAEVARLHATENGASLMLYTADNQTGEIRFESAEPIRLIAGDVESHIDGDHAITLVVRGDRPAPCTLHVGEKTLTLMIRTRDQAAAHELTIPSLVREPGCELLEQNWRCRLMKPGPLTHQWTGDARAMELSGITQGAAWYEMDVELDQPTHGPLCVEYAAEFAGAFADEQYLGTVQGNGGQVQYAIDTPLAAGQHTLRFRTEIWGHSNFNEGKWPSGTLGSLRGLIGKVSLNDQPLTGRWRCGAEHLTSAEQLPDQQGKLTGSPGTTVEARLSLAPMPHGATLIITADDVIGELWLGDNLLGRFAFGPSIPAKSIGGPKNEFHLPAPMTAHPADLRVIVRPLTTTSQITSLQLCPLAV